MRDALAAGEPAGAWRTTVTPRASGPGLADHRHAPGEPAGA